MRDSNFLGYPTLSVWKKMIPLLNDPKPTVVRQCLASLHEVVLYLPEMTDDIVAAVSGIDLSQYKDSMSPLIKKDAVDVLGCLSAGVR